MIHIDRDQAVSLLHRVVKERGESYVYEQPTPIACKYAWDGAPSCGVGLALNLAGMSIQGLEKLDDDAGCIDEGEAPPILNEFDVILSPEAAKVLGEFQYAQDRGTPYGKALATALHRWPEGVERCGIG